MVLETPLCLKMPTLSKPRPGKAILRTDTGISTLSDGTGPVEMEPLSIPEHDGVAQWQCVCKFVNQHNDVCCAVHMRSDP